MPRKGRRVSRARAARDGGGGAAAGAGAPESPLARAPPPARRLGREPTQDASDREGLDVRASHDAAPAAALDLCEIDAEVPRDAARARHREHFSVAACAAAASGCAAVSSAGASCLASGSRLRFGFAFGFGFDLRLGFAICRLLALRRRARRSACRAVCELEQHRSDGNGLAFLRDQIARSRPAAGAGISTVALSVMTSTIAWCSCNGVTDS